MPYPPTFTNVWDITQPPDTQLANLLGQDIRSLKLDTMQRMSSLSGTLGNRPTPEVVNATWGGAGFGILYFATDTGQVFQWNGTQWNQISLGTAKYIDPTSYNASVTTTTAGVVIPANTLLSGSQIVMNTFGVTSSGSGSAGSYKLQITGVGLSGLPLFFLPLAAQWAVQATYILNASGSKLVVMGYAGNTSTVIVVSGGIPFNTAVPITINSVITPTGGAVIGQYTMSALVNA